MHRSRDTVKNLCDDGQTYSGWQPKEIAESALLSNLTNPIAISAWDTSNIQQLGANIRSLTLDIYSYGHGIAVGADATLRFQPNQNLYPAFWPPSTLAGCWERRQNVCARLSNAVKRR